MPFSDMNREIDLRPGERIYGTDNTEALRGWALLSGSRFVPHGREHQLEATGAAEAVWSRAMAADYTLVFSFQAGRGTGIVGLQRSGERGESSEYRLRLAADHVAISRLSGGQERMLGSASVKFAPDQWHTACVESCGGWKRLTIDSQELLKIEDPQPLPAGPQVFCSMENDKVTYADVHLTPWTGDDAKRIREIIERVGAALKPVDKPPPSKPPATASLPPQVVPLETAVFKYVYGGPHTHVRKPSPINPGDIPPHFVHTWILDLKGIETFRLHLASFADIKLHKDDRISIYNLQGLKSTPPQPLASFTVAAKADAMTVNLSKAPFDKVRMGPDYKRIYIQLETSPDYVPRRFFVSGLAIDKNRTGAEEALIFGDDTDYDTGAPVIAYEPNKQGIPKEIQAPWVAGWYTNYNSYPPPDPAKGWYLVAKYLTNHDQTFYALAYYNEQRSRLRLYLYNLDIPMNVTGATATVSLERYAPAKDAYGQTYLVRAPLSGAIFPLHPNPNRWSSATVPLDSWGPSNWACVEVPMLYPMADNVPVDLSKTTPLPPAMSYRSLYEEPLLKGLRGIWLKLHISTYDLGQFEGTLTGQAVGQAIENINQQQPGFFDTLKAAGGAAGDSFKNGYAVYKEVRNFYDNTIKNPPADMSSFQLLSNVVSVGASAFAGVGSIVGAALSFVNLFLGGKPKPPLRMSIMLDLNATLNGQLKIEHTLLGPSVAFYLPGRFAIDEAVPLGLLADNPDVTACSAPRYDRAMGLFGYRYEPSEVIFPLWRGETVPYIYQHLGAAFPVLPNVTVKYESNQITRPLRDDIERLLPIIYNPFAEIKPMRPIVVKSETAPWPCTIAVFSPQDDWIRKMFNLEWGLTLTKWHFDVAWKTHVAPELDDKSFPPDAFAQDSEHGPALSVRVRFHDDARAMLESTVYSYGPYEYDPNGLLIQVSPIPDCIPHTYKDFKDVKYLKVMQDYSYSNVKEREDAKGNWISIMDVKDTYPYDNVAYFWDIPYFYYGRSRKANGAVPSLRWTAPMCCPVMLHITTSQGSYDNGAQAWNELKKSDLIPSKLLEP